MLKKVFILGILGVLCWSVNLSAQCTTTVSGNLDGQVWTPDGSPFCVDGDVTVTDLVIEPGVVVVFTGNFNFEVSGTLTAVGTIDAQIKFKKADGVTGWQGISILEASQNTQLINCSISGYSNGGLKIYNSTPVVRKCYLIGNDNAISGSGLYVTLSTSSSDHLVIEDSTVSNNHKYGNGAGIFAELSAGSMVLRHCFINNNTSTYESSGNRSGGGIMAYANGGLELENCEISGNTAASYEYYARAHGGGIYVAEGNVIFKHCIIKSNLASASRSSGYGNAYAYGAGVYASTGNLQFLNSIISNNSPSGTNGHYGGGIYNSLAAVDLTNCTVVSNVAYGIYNAGGVAQAANCIIYNNSGGQIFGTAGVNHSDVQGGHAGEGNIDEDPLFQNIFTYQLRCDYSPCVDTGNAYPWYNDSCFLPSCGEARNDMGAYGGPDACAWCAYGGALTLGPCEVPPLGDFNEDGDVDAADLFLFSGNYGTE